MHGAPTRASGECADERGAGCADERVVRCADERRADGLRAGCADERGAGCALRGRTPCGLRARANVNMNEHTVLYKRPGHVWR